MISVGHKIQMLRQASGLTQARLAEKTNIPQGAISNIEKGERDMTVSTLVNLCAAMGVSPAEVFESHSPDSQRHWITRNRIEKIARAFWGNDEIMNTKERELVLLLRKVIPSGRKPRSQKSVYSAWSMLRSQYTKDEITIFAERVRGEANRRHA